MSATAVNVVIETHEMADGSFRATVADGPAWARNLYTSGHRSHAEAYTMATAYLRTDWQGAGVTFAFMHAEHE